MTHEKITDERLAELCRMAEQSFDIIGLPGDARLALEAVEDMADEIRALRQCVADLRKAGEDHIAQIRDAGEEIGRLRARVAELETPDMFWDDTYGASNVDSPTRILYSDGEALFRRARRMPDAVYRGADLIAVEGTPEFAAWVAKQKEADHD